MTLFAVAKNQAADGITVDKITLHSGDPGTGAANELSTAGGIYSAKAIAFGAAADGVRTQTADVLFDVPAGASVSHYCLWQGTTAKKKGAFAATEVYAAQGQHRVKDGTITITG
jgi:hypothetical protein